MLKAGGCMHTLWIWKEALWLFFPSHMVDMLGRVSSQYFWKAARARFSDFLTPPPCTISQRSQNPQILSG